MSTTKLTLEYDGSGFAGWAAQPGLKTVQGELEWGLETVLRHPVKTTVAGRTDRGVHAWGQVVSYEGNPPRLASINAITDSKLTVLSAESVPDGFNARCDALSRTYCYRILLRKTPSALESKRALWWPYPCDRDALDACASALIGTKNFTAFTPTQTTHVRFERDIFKSEWRDYGDVIEFWIEADAFMRHMNRILIGTMLQVAGGRRSLESFCKLLMGQSREFSGPTAPPFGLYFAGASYKVDGDATTNNVCRFS